MPNTVQQNIAYQVLIGMGFSADKARLEQSILATARLVPTMTELAYCEGYFYEEMIFATILGLETEVRFGLISYVIEGWRQEHGLTQQVRPTDVYGGLKEIAYPVACDRMRLAGIEPTPIAAAHGLEDRFLERIAEYERLVKEHLACDQPVEKQEWAAGLSRREHPFEKYLGAVSDHIARALDIDAQAIEAQALDEVAIEHAVMLKWRTVMDAARQACESG